jgi:serine protease Do
MKMRRSAPALAFALILLLGTPPAAADELPDLADRVQPSVVSISAERTDQPPNADTSKSNLRQGTGMVLSVDGYIVTALSLVDKVGKITVVFSDGKTATAQIAGLDPRTGVALLKETTIPNLTAVHLGDAHILRRGNPVFSIGNVYTLQNSLSAGVVAAIRRVGAPIVHLILQTDMVVQPGSTGAPLFNMKGELVGMFTSGYSNAGKRTGVGLAVTSNLIKEVTDQLQKFGTVDRGWLGARVRTPTDQEASALAMAAAKSLIIDSVIDGAPAAGAGLTPGDGIATFNGQPVSDALTFSSNITSLPANSDVTLGIVRKSGRSDVRVKLARLPDMPTTPSATPAPVPEVSPANKDANCLRYVPSVGMTVAITCEE